MNSKLHVDVVTCRNARSVERPEENDLQVELTVRELKQLVGEAQLAALTETSGFPTSFTTIKVRRCSAIGQCINFHTDFFCKRTMQVALNGADATGVASSSTSIPQGYTFRLVRLALQPSMALVRQSRLTHPTLHIVDPPL